MVCLTGGGLSSEGSEVTTLPRVQDRTQEVSYITSCAQVVELRLSTPVVVGAVAVTVLRSTHGT